MKMTIIVITMVKTPLMLTSAIVLLLMLRVLWARM